MNVKKKIANLSRRLATLGLPTRAYLRFDFAAARFEGDAELEMVGLSHIPAPAGLAVDIGANQGWFTYCLSQRFASVMAFEPNPDLAAQLSQRVPHNVSVYAVAISDSDGQANFYVPLVNRQALHGWGSLEAAHFDQSAERQTYVVQRQTLDSYKLNDLALLKVDVEGHERAVFAGAMQTISQNLPTIVAEIRPPDQAYLRQTFLQLGYVELQPEKLMPAVLNRRYKRANFIFVHPNRVVAIPTAALLK